LVDGDSIYVRATSPQSAGYSNVATATVAGPQVSTATFAAPDQVTINATSATSTIAGAEYSVGAAAAPAGTGTNVIDTFGNATYSGTVTVTPQPLGGQLVWARVRDAAGVWSQAKSVTIPGPTVDTLTFTAPDQLQIAASSSAANIVAAEYSVGASAAAPGAGTSVGGVFGNPTYTFTATLTPAPANGATVWVRVKDSNGTWSQATSVAAVYPKPIVDVTTAFTSPDQLTIDAHAVIGNVAAAEISVGATAAAAGSGTSVGSTFGAPTYSETVTVAPQPTTGDIIWVRVQDSYGTWSSAISVTV
jgi:hypothetical protein